MFEATHRLLLRLIAEGKVQGVRLDHIDGMYDPSGYCRRLLARAADVLTESQGGERPEIDARRGRPIYLLVEKILARHENLREDLPVAGTTGYEFINLVNGLFVDPAAERSLTATYHRFIDREPEFDRVLLAAKAADPPLFPEQRAARARPRVPPPRAAELDDARLHAHRTARGARRHHHALPGLPDLHHRRRRQAGGPARSRLGDRPGAQGDRAGRSHGVRLPARRAVHRSGRHARLRARRRHRHRDALSAAHRAGHGEGDGGHRVLPLQPPGLPERGRRRARTISGSARAAFHHVLQQQLRRHPGSMLATRDPRPQARRGRARADRRPERAAARMAPPGSPLGPAQPPQAPGGRRPARARAQRRVPALPDADRRLAARDRHARASRAWRRSPSGSSPT